jgi:hypothetical protein
MAVMQSGENGELCAFSQLIEAHIITRGRKWIYWSLIAYYKAAGGGCSCQRELDFVVPGVKRSSSTRLGEVRPEPFNNA